jgi:hypothetical protein
VHTVWQVRGYGQLWQGPDPRRRASYLGRSVNGQKDGFGVSRYPGGALFYKVRLAREPFAVGAGSHLSC